MPDFSLQFQMAALLFRGWTVHNSETFFFYGIRRDPFPLPIGDKEAGI